MGIFFFKLGFIHWSYRLRNETVSEVEEQENTQVSKTGPQSLQPSLDSRRDLKWAASPRRPP